MHLAWLSAFVLLSSTEPTVSLEVSSLAPRLSSSGNDLGAPPAWESMTLHEVVERAVAFNFDISLAKEETRRKGAQRRQVLGAALPTLSASGAFLHLDHTRELAGRVLMGQNQLSGNAIITIPAIAPRIWGNVRQADRAEGLARDHERAMRRQIALDAARAYLSALDVNHRLQALEHAHANQKTHLLFAQARHEAGLATKLDVLRAEQTLQTTEVALSSARSERVGAYESLGLITGLLTPVSPSAEAVFADVPAAQEALLKMPWRREDVREAQSALELAQKVYKNSWLDYMPTLWAAGAVLSTHPATPTAPKLGWQVQLLLTLPLYDGGVRDAERIERQSQQTSSLIALDALLRQSRSELRQAYAALDEAQKALRSAHQSTSAAQEAAKLAQRAYRAGATSNLEVVDAERVALDAATLRAESEDTLKKAQLELLAAAGLFPAL